MRHAAAPWGISALVNGSLRSSCPGADGTSSGGSKNASGRGMPRWTTTLASTRTSATSAPSTAPGQPPPAPARSRPARPEPTEVRVLPAHAGHDLAHPDDHQPHREHDGDHQHGHVGPRERQQAEHDRRGAPDHRVRAGRPVHARAPGRGRAHRRPGAPRRPPRPARGSSRPATPPPRPRRPARPSRAPPTTGRRRPARRCRATTSPTTTTHHEDGERGERPDREHGAEQHGHDAEGQSQPAGDRVVVAARHEPKVVPLRGSVPGAGRRHRSGVSDPRGRVDAWT